MKRRDFLKILGQSAAGASMPSFAYGLCPPKSLRVDGAGASSPEPVCSIVAEPPMYQETFSNRALGKITGVSPGRAVFFDGGQEAWRYNRNGDNTSTFIEITDTNPLGDLAGRHMRTRLVRDANGANYRTELTLMRAPSYLPMTRVDFQGRQYPEWYLPHDLWYGFRMRVNRCDQAVGGHYCQWHNADGPVDYGNPPVSVWGEKTGLRLYLERNRAIGGNYFSSYFVRWGTGAGQIPFGTSIDLMFRIRWDSRIASEGGQGAIDVYLNENENAVVTWRGPTCHGNGATLGPSPYFRWGLYMGYWRDAGPSSYQEQLGFVQDQEYDQFTAMGENGSRMGVKPKGPRGGSTL
jgi:hypothetical protein